MACKVTVHNGELPQDEIDAYVAMLKMQNRVEPMSVDIKVDGDYVELRCKLPPFQRIRRITGYIVGTLDRFNSAKLAEVRDRVIHELSE